MSLLRERAAFWQVFSKIIYSAVAYDEDKVAVEEAIENCEDIDTLKLAAKELLDEYRKEKIVAHVLRRELREATEELDGVREELRLMRRWRSRLWKILRKTDQV